MNLQKGDIIKLVTSDTGYSFPGERTFGIYDSIFDASSYNVYLFDDGKPLGIFSSAMDSNIKPVALNPVMFTDNGFHAVIGQGGELTFEKEFPPGYKGIYYPSEKIFKVFAKEQKEKRTPENYWVEWYKRYVPYYNDMQHIMNKFRDPIADNFNNFIEEHYWPEIFSIEYSRNGKPVALRYNSKLGSFIIGKFEKDNFLKDFSGRKEISILEMQVIYEYDYEINQIVNFFTNIYKK